jgi:peptidoglycan/xylan/chitin deacetylase (PgdA/CDA1 family)
MRRVATRLVLIAAAALLVRPGALTRAQTTPAWPGGARMALSLSFNDGRVSQVNKGVPVFARHGARVTLFVVPSAIEPHFDGWKRAVAAGHEIGNHSLTHSCRGNFAFSRQKALEEHPIPRMREKLIEANRRIPTLLRVTPRTFAYPCGQTFVGRAPGTQRYVPVVADLFLAGRGWRDESSNDPAFVDLAVVTRRAWRCSTSSSPTRRIRRAASGQGKTGHCRHFKSGHFPVSGLEAD